MFEVLSRNSNVSGPPIFEFGEKLISVKKSPPRGGGFGPNGIDTSNRNEIKNARKRRINHMW